MQVHEINSRGTERVIGGVCVEGVAVMDDGAHQFRKRGLLVAKGAVAEEWNRDDPAYLDRMLREMRAEQRMPRQRQARWN